MLPLLHGQLRSLHPLLLVVARKHEDLGADDGSLLGGTPSEPCRLADGPAGHGAVRLDDRPVGQPGSALDSAVELDAGTSHEDDRVPSLVPTLGGDVQLAQGVLGRGAGLCRGRRTQVGAAKQAAGGKQVDDETDHESLRCQ